MSESKINWLASYPKSGNTWLRILLGNYLNRSDMLNEDSFARVGTISSIRHPFDELTGLPSSDLTDDEIDLLRPPYYQALCKGLDEDIFIKTHDSYHKNKQGEWLFPASCSKHVVYIVRNPLDVAISFAHHAGHKDYGRTIKKMNNPNAFLAGSNNEQFRQIMGSWSDHFTSWTEQSSIPVLIVKYEDMLTDAKAELVRVLNFLGLNDKDRQSDLMKAVDASSFNKLQKLETENTFVERPEKSERFFRSGRSGEGTEKLTEQLKNKLIEKHGDVMSKLGYQ